MAFFSDIAESWRRPATVLRRHLARGQSEPFAFTLLLAFLILAFIAQWPGIARLTAASPDMPMSPHLLARGLALLASIPMWYGLAALGHLAARGMGGKGGWYSARMALFWALCTASPLMLLTGLVEGVIGPGVQLTAARIASFAAFVAFWLLNLREAGRGAVSWT